MQNEIHKPSLKPIVRYTMANYIKVGDKAEVTPVDHPNHLPGHAVSNDGRPVWTSKVVSYDPKTGEFETNNTYYKPQ